MLEVRELRHGTLEFFDSGLHGSRNKIFRAYRALLLIRLVMIFLFFLVILMRILIIDYNVIPYVTISSLLIIVTYSSARYIQNNYLPGSLASFVLLIDDKKGVTSLKVQNWLDTRMNEFSQYDIRFNQAVGFKCLLMDDGSFTVEIIVDENYPGQAMFRALYLESIVDFKRSMNVIFPNKIEWYFTNEDGSPWSDDDLMDLEEAMELSRVPVLLRDYFKI